MRVTDTGGGFDRIIVAGLISVAGVLIMAKGGNSAWANSLLATTVPVMFALNWVFREKTLSEISQQKLVPWLSVWGVVTVCIFIQVFSGKWMLPAPPEIADCKTLGVCTEQNISGYPLRTLAFWASFSAYWMIVWLVSKMNSARVRFIAISILLIALFQGLYGVFSMVNESRQILGIWEKEYYLGHATGTFVNRNHFSGFLELCWPLGLSAIVVLASRAKFERCTGLQSMLLIFFSLIMALATFSSHSRLGAISAITGILVWLLLMGRQRYHVQRNNLVAYNRNLYFAAIGIGVLGAVWFGVDLLADRFFLLSGSQGRFSAWRATLDIPAILWITGIGAGNFIDVFRMVQPAGLDPVFEFAHNDYLEFILDFGLVGSTLIAMVFLIWLKSVSPKKLSIMQIGAASGISAILVHSIGDFNLHIPGVAVVFWIAVGIFINPNLVRGCLQVNKDT